MRLPPLALMIALALISRVEAQDRPVAPKKKSAASQDAKRPAGKRGQTVHKKPTPEQIRKFNELEKKQAAEPEKK